MKIKITKKNLRTLLIVGTIYSYLIGGMIYNGIRDYKIRNELYKKAITKTDINYNKRLEIDEVFNVFKKLKIDGKDIIRRSSYEGKINYFKQAVFKEDLPSELKDKIVDELRDGHYQISTEVIKLADKNNDNFIDYEEAYDVFKITYKDIEIEKLNLSTDIGIKRSLLKIVYPFKTYKGSELERFVNEY